MATADLAGDSRNVGTGETPQEAMWAALRALGEPCERDAGGGAAAWLGAAVTLSSHSGR